MNMSSGNSPVCRFAPSPTGFLHVGNLRTAIVNFLFAKKTGGKFILRYDDTDTQRVKKEYEEAIESAFDWIGIKPDLIERQSSRYKFYEVAKEKLLKTGRIYECYESEEELSLQRKTQIASGIPPLYDRGSLNLTEEQKKNLRDCGIKPYYRFLLDDAITSWDDKVKGKISYTGRHFSDPVVIRENGVPTYVFCSVVDDIDMGVTDIIRGEDHITNTAIQIQMFRAICGSSPDFSHLPLMKTSAKKISKRVGGSDVKSLIEDGIEPLSAMNFFAQIGTSEQITPHSDINALVAQFDMSNFSKSSCNYDFDAFCDFNHKMLQVLTETQIKESLRRLKIDADTKFVLSIVPNLSSLKEVPQWVEVCKSKLRYNNADADKEFLSKAASVLPQDTKSPSSYNEWISLIKANTDRGGKNLFMPIRLALTGLEHGPELKVIFNLLDRDEMIARLTN